MLQGLMDTDGYINKENGVCEFSSVRERLADDVSELLSSLGIKHTVRGCAARLNGREVSRVYRIGFSPPVDLPVFRLRRKRQHQYTRHSRRRLSGDRRIVSVDPVDSVAVRCIKVDSRSQLFLAGRSMIPTHNTPWLAGIGLFGLVIDGERAAEIFSAATQREQASIMLRDAIRMASESDDLREILNIGKHNIAHEPSHSFFRVVSAEHKGLDGKRPHFALIDELHEHRDGMVVDKMRAGFKGRDQPMEVDITNAGSDTTSICWEHHQRSLDILEGVISDESWFAYVCHLDPCDDCYEKGYRQPRDQCKDCDDWTDLDVAEKVNPNLGVTIDRDYLAHEVELAIGIPSKQALCKRLNFCLWTQSHTVWIPPDEWRACQVPEVSTENEARNPCAAGLDLSAKLDLTSFVIALRINDERDPDEVQIEGTDQDGAEVVQKLTLNYRVELIPFFWLPRDTLIERVKTERIPYDVWHRAGDLRVTDGGAIDYDVIYETIVKETAPRYRFTALGYDPREATQLAVQLRDRGRVTLTELAQGRKLSEALKLIEALVKTRRLRHNGNSVLAWCFSNAEPKADRFENLWIEKPSQNKRIDGAVAAAMAIHQLMLIPGKRGRRVRASVVGLHSVTPLSGDERRRDERRRERERGRDA